MTGFLDTNILIYPVVRDRRSEVSLSLIDGINRIGVQSLNEFANVARRRLQMDWVEINGHLGRLRAICPPPQALTLDIHQYGLKLAERYRFGLYDAMIVAAALAAGCDTLWSEDMHDGLVVDGRLTIRNPFA